MDRIYRMDLRRGVSSTGLYAGIILSSLAGVFGMGEMLEYIAETILPEGEIRFCAAACLALGTEALAYALPISSTLAVSGMYIEDMESRVLYYSILRTTKKRYHTSKVFSCIFFGFLTVFASLLVLLILFGIMFPPNRGELQALQMESLLPLCSCTLILCMNSSLYALLGGCIAVASRNRYMAYASPFILYYVISTLLQAYLSGYPILNPREWMLMRISGEGQILAVLIAANVIAAAGYLLAMERRWNHE